jgi:hypothetical protein
MTIVAPPLVSIVAADVYPPPVSVTEPVAVGAPIPPFTATVTVVPCTVVMLDGDGVTVTVGVTFVTVTEFVPDALLYVGELAASGV